MTYLSVIIAAMVFPAVARAVESVQTYMFRASATEEGPMSEGMIFASIHLRRVRCREGESRTALISGEINKSYERTETQVTDGYRLLKTNEVSTFLLRVWPEDCRQAPRLFVQDFSGTGDEQNVWRF